MELMKVADALIEKIKREYPNDISLVALCGSYIYNDTHDKSDLDFYFIPKTERGYEMTRCFILENIGFDFWGMSWERAESLARYNETNTSIISEAKIIYYNSQEDLDRFNRLRTLGESIEKSAFLAKANEQMNICYDCYFKMLESKANFAIVKQQAIWILYFTSFSISLLNASYVKRGGRHLLREILDMEFVPADFEKLYTGIIESNDANEIISASQQVIINMRDLLSGHKEASIVKLADKANDFYEELKSIYNKLLHECETCNQQGIMLAIARLDHDVSDLLDSTEYAYSDFPDLFSISQKHDMSVLIDAVNLHEKHLVDILEKEQIGIVKYMNYDEFSAHLER